MRSKRFFIFLCFHFFILGFLLSFPDKIFPEGKTKSEVPTIGGIYRKPLEFKPRTLDPALATDIYSVSVLQQVFDGLVQFDRNLNIIPATAKSWKVSQDGLTYTFYLREGVKFHNGREATADDFIYSFTRIIDPEHEISCRSFIGPNHRV